MNFSREIFHRGYSPKIPIGNSFYVLLSLSRLNFTRGDVKGHCPE